MNYYLEPLELGGVWFAPQLRYDWKFSYEYAFNGANSLPLVRHSTFLHF